VPRNRRDEGDRFNGRPLVPSQRDTPNRHSQEEGLSQEPFDYELHGGFGDETTTSTLRAQTTSTSSQGTQSVLPKLGPPKTATVFGTGHDDIDLPLTDEEKNAILVRPTEHPGGSRTWRHQLGADAVVYGVLVPKNAGKCEDAPPLVVKSLQSDHSPTFLGVFDGMGGAGAGPVTYEPKKLSSEAAINTSEALLASRLARRETLKVALAPQDGDFAERLKATVRSRLEKAVKLLQVGEKSRIRGTMTKRLPTTLVVTRVSKGSPLGESTIETWWAGDSRAFIVTPRSGLVALTSDHVRNRDPLDQLRSDPPIENVVNCSTDFFIDTFAKTIKGPFVLLLATDGVFGYLPTPGYLELGLLESLTAGSEAFPELFSGFCSRFAADDVCAAVLASGFGSHEAVEEAFRARLQLLRDRYTKLEGLLNSNSDVNEEAHRLWQIERTGYLHLRGDSLE
jgi:serine/threonine protein phosphatase PrpC